MLRVRFKANAEDCRPVNWPVKHPYWCSGYAGDMSHSTIISYADDEEYITDNWPEAEDLEVEEVDGYHFTDRFPKPDWFNEDDDDTSYVFDVDYIKGHSRKELSGDIVPVGVRIIELPSYMEVLIFYEPPIVSKDGSWAPGPQAAALLRFMNGEAFPSGFTKLVLGDEDKAMLISLYRNKLGERENKPVLALAHRAAAWLAVEEWAHMKSIVNLPTSSVHELVDGIIEEGSKEPETS